MGVFLNKLRIISPRLGRIPFGRYRTKLSVVSINRVAVLLLLLTFGGAACHPLPAPSATVSTDPQSARQAWLDQFARGYFPGRSGQVFLVSREGDFVVDRNPLYAFMHGSPWDYDTHIPLLFYGAPFIKPGASKEAVSQQDVVPTLAALLGTAPPATAIGRTLQQAIASTTTRPGVI